MHFLFALVVAVVGISLTDWLFFGVMFHDRYLRTPEIWRDIPEGKKIAGSMVFAVISAFVYLRLLSDLGIHDALGLFKLSLCVWLAVSLPQTVTNTIYIKYAPEIVITHSLGWLARIMVTSAAYHFFLM
jgi:hypothetical protein